MILSIFFVSVLGYSQTENKSIKTVKQEQVDAQQKKLKSKQVQKAGIRKASPKHTKLAPSNKKKYVRNTKVSAPASRKGNLIKLAKKSPNITPVKKKPNKKRRISTNGIAAPMPKS